MIFLTPHVTYYLHLDELRYIYTIARDLCEFTNMRNEQRLSSEKLKLKKILCT